MIPLTLAEVVAAAGGVLHDADPAAMVTGPVVIDSRLAVPGSLFVAIKGEHADGHEHAAAAVRSGAIAVLAARSLGGPTIVADDPVAGLARLARAVLDRLGDVTVVAVTGSSGKTSTKDLLAAVLETAGPTVAAVGSYNNEIGVPLTVLAADPATRHLVVEMGARGAGHISYLCEVAPPRIGVVLNIGTAHAGEFGSREATAVAKRELVEALPSDGVAVLNADDPLVRAMATATSVTVLTFGASSAADVRAQSVEMDDQGRAAFDLLTPSGAHRVQLRLHGLHHVSNALAAAAVARVLRIPVDDVARALGDATPRSRWRMEVVERADGVTVVNDAYNANPESVQAALETVAAMSGGRRSWAVLGEMRELGAASATEHARVGTLAVRLGLNRVVAVGDGARGISDAAKETAVASTTYLGEEPDFVSDVDEALALLRDQVRPGDVVLVKASRAVGLERVALGLLEAGAPA
ncbi:MAG: UDP-N-acetylmuramoyl-tripeptide--D-alanyl-D-alanine ligase [Sporichthyaceae bacterium]